ncbi:MAG: hypothetical protein WC621_02045 [Patescibacteria group bacterium]
MTKFKLFRYWRQSAVGLAIILSLAITSQYALAELTFSSFNINSQGNLTLTFDGTTIDTNKTTLGVTDPTASRTITLQDNSGLVPLATAANTLFFTTTANTSLILPTSGTLATLAGTETLLNKTLSTGSTWQGNVVGVAYGGTGVSTLTGLIKGNGASAFSAATAGTDYSAGTSALATGILKSTTTTGALTIAVAGDFPTLNQNTTGSAATLTTTRAINGVNFDGSGAITVPVNNADDITTAATMYPLWTATAGGNYAAKVSTTKLSFNPATGLLTATGFSGPLTGNVTGNVTGSSGSTTGNAATVTGLAVTAGKTLTISNTLTLAGTDASTLNIGTGGTLGTAAYTASSAYEVPLTFSTGLTRSVNTITVNTSQNITALSNLTTNGFVKTGGGIGTLSIDTTAYAPLASPTFTGTVIIPTPFTIGAISMTATGTELNYVAGVTSAIQTQINAKGVGDMVLASAQTNSGIKTFLNTTMKLRNVANTFDGYFVNTNTADRIYTLPDRALTLDNITTASTTNGTGFLKGNGTVISFDNSTYLTSVGTGTINELTYWSGANTLGSLATATYPSLTELSYVKGVTSAIQTQLNAKGVGDMVLASAQTNSGIKTFLNTTMKLRNVANTFDGYFVNTNTADRIYTLKDAAGTLAFTSDITGTNSGTNTGDQTITLSGDVSGTGTGAITTAIGALKVTNAMIAAGTIDLAAKVTGILPTANGGTGIAFFTAAGPTVARVYTFPDAAATILTSNALITLAQGGTGANLTASNGGILYSTASAGAILSGTATAGQILRSGASAAPTWSTATYPATAGTSGNVLTSDGTNFVSQVPVSKTAFSTEFSTSARFELVSVGSGTTSFGSYGVSVNTGATITSSQSIRVNFQTTNAKLFAGSPIYSVLVNAAAIDASNGAASTFFGIGQPTVNGSGHTYTDAHIGFKIIKSGGVVNLYATQADGTTENASASLTTLAGSEFLDLIFVVNGTTSVDYYWRKNGGALSAATNLTANLPTAIEGKLQWSVSNNDTAVIFRIELVGSNYQR